MEELVNIKQQTNRKINSKISCSFCHQHRYARVFDKIHRMLSIDHHRYP